MPSLRELRDFASSFGRVGGEDKTRAALRLPPDDLPLPDYEPTPLPPSGTAEPARGGAPAGPVNTADATSPDDTNDADDTVDAAGAAGPDDTVDTDAADDAAGTNSADDAADATGPDDTAGATGPDDTAGATGPDDAADATGPDDTADATGPDDTAGAAGANSADDAADANGPGDMAGPAGANGPDDTADTNDTNPTNRSDGAAGPTGVDDGLDFSDLVGSAGPDLDMDRLDQELASAEAAAAEAAATEAAATEAASAEAAAGETGDNGPADTAADNDADATGDNAPADTAGGGDAERQQTGDDAPADTAGGGDAAQTFDLDGPASDRAAAEAEADAIFNSAVRDPKTLAQEPQPILLTEDEVARIQATITSYPLNLRVACEEIIVEEAVAPDLMSALLRHLIDGAPARETAALAGRILSRTIIIPAGFEKKTGAELEAEQAKFSYIFVHSFLPVFRIFLLASLVAVSLGYLIWNYVYIPLKAESIYQLGYERIFAGEYGRANERFREAFALAQKKKWFYRYAEAFRDERQYLYAEEKYDQLLNFTASRNKRGIPEKKAVLDYAALETTYLRNYDKADSLLRRYILDYAIWDRDALLALGDNALAWGEVDPSRLEDAREAYARLIERYGQTPPVLERMLKYLIRVDNLKEVLPLKTYFMGDAKPPIAAATLAELGGYLLDKQTEVIRGVPNEYLDRIDGIRDVLLRAIRQDPRLPESFYHLARYYQSFESTSDERLTLERAVETFDAAREETPKRLGYHINAIRRYAEILINAREFFPAEEQLIKGAGLYEDGVGRRVIARSPEHGRIYASLGDLEYFVKDGDMAKALDYYGRSEANGYAPPELLYRMGAARYQMGQWEPALERLFDAASKTAFNRRILYALGNASYLRGDYYAAQGYYTRLLEVLNADRSRFPLIAPSDNAEQLDLAERLMVAQNNLGVTLEALADRTGNTAFRTRAQGLYADSERAWDVMTRNPQTMARMRPSPETAAPGVNPAYLNVQNSLHPVPGYERQFFLRIDKDALEPSAWEERAPPGYRLSEGLMTTRE